MPTQFQIKRNSVSGVRPTTSNIQPGELAVNIQDGILFSANATTVFEVGANNTAVAIGNSTVRQTVNSTGAYVNGDINLVKNNTKLIFNPTAAAGAANVYFILQSDDNFVFYNTTNTGATKAVFNIYANTNSPNQNSAVKFNVPIDPVSGIFANNSIGTSGQLLASNGSSIYWTSPSAASVNLAAQYTWSNLHTFAANVSFTGNGIGIATNTGAIYLGGISDANWRVGRNTGGTTKWSYTNNTIDVIVASSPNEGFAIGVVSGNSVFETGYKGTYIASNVTIGNSTVATTINATAFSGAANSALYANSSVSNLFTVGTASYFVANGNLGIGTSTPGYLLDVAGTIRGQSVAGAGDVLIIGNDSKLVDINTSDTAGLYSTTNTLIGSLKLGSNGGIISGYNGAIGIGNTLPDATLSVTGTANISANVYFGDQISVLNKIQIGTPGAFTFGTAAEIEIDANQNNYIQVVIQNANTGNNSSSDLVVTNDTGNDTTNFVDLGINGSTYNQTAFNIGGAGDGYLYASNGALTIGTATAKELIFHANGTTSADRKFTVNSAAITIANSVALVANGSNGTSGQLLSSNGTGVAWTSSVPSLNVSTNTGFTLGTSSKAANGYSFLPNGLIMQWGTVSSNSSTGNITFPIAFGTLYNVTLGSVSTVWNATYTPLLLAANATTANVRTGNANARNVYFMAVGV